MHTRLKSANFTYLLVGLLTTLIIYPVTLDFFSHNSVFITNLTFSVTMVIGIWSLHESKALFRFGLLLTLLSLGLSLLEPLFPALYLQIFGMVVLATFCIMSIAFILADLTRDMEVDSNRVVGAVCLYLLIGMVFGIFYTILETLLPGSFSDLPDASYGRGDVLFYYSYVTLTTLGYGDIVPLRPIARTLTYIEAIVGVFYMAVMIGSMIGLLLSRANAKIIEKNNAN